MGRPRLHFRVYCTANLRPLLRQNSVGYAKYSTATHERPSLAPKVERGGCKLFKNADDAVADLKSGSTILSSGFGLCGVAGTVPDFTETESKLQVTDFNAARNAHISHPAPRS